MTKKETEGENLRHKHRMKEIEFEKKCKVECIKLILETKKEMQRIKNADIERAVIRRGRGY